MNFIRLAVGFGRRIHHIYHLVDDFLHHRVSQGSLRKNLKAVGQLSAVQFLSREGMGMVVACKAAGIIVSAALFQMRQYLGYSLMAERGVVLFKLES